MAKLTNSTTSQIVPGTECNPECNLCPKLCGQTFNVCMEGDGPRNAKLMIIGEAPGAVEDDMNLPFVGTSGTFLREELLFDAEIPETAVRFTNAVRCHPPKNKTPTASEIQRCRPYLESEIRRIRPRVIVGMGNVPLAALLHRFYKGAPEEGASKKSEGIVSGISRWQGKVIWLREFECWFIPTYHPSFCIRNEQARSTYSTDVVTADLKKAWELSKKPRPDFKYPKCVIVKTEKEALIAISKMRENTEYSFDIETGGSGRAIDKWVLGCSISCSENIGYYIPWDLVVAHRRVRKALYALLTDKSLYKIMHNGAYELRIFRFLGIPIYDKYYDTMIAAHMIDENFSMRLKDLAWTMTPFGGYDVELEKYKQDHRIKEDYSKIPENIRDPYAAYDAIATWIIYKKTKAVMVAEKVKPLFDKVSMPVRRVMCDAEYTGISVDIEWAKKMHEACNSAMSKLEEKVYSIAGHAFNIASTQQLSKVLYGELKFKPLKKTKTGYSTDSDSIEYILTQKNKHSDIAKYLSDRQYVKTMNKTHILQPINFYWPEDGKIHANYNTTGTVTGRTSCSRPSLQNVPADALIRSIYTASPGNVLVDGDLKSAELAAIAAVSGERTFIDAFENGLDPHSATYRRIYSLPDSYECSEIERRKAKTINFGLVYGLTPVGLAKRLDMSVEEATDFIKLYFKRLPNIYTWLEEQKAVVRKYGYVTSVFHRRRRLPLGLSDKFGDVGRAERQAMNAPIQSGAADYTYIGLIRLSRLLRENGLQSKIVHTVHDCGIIDTIPAEQEDVVACFKEAFEKPIKALPIKMRVDIKITTRWGEHNKSKLSDILKGVGLDIAA